MHRQRLLQCRESGGWTRRRLRCGRDRVRLPIGRLLCRIQFHPDIGQTGKRGPQLGLSFPGHDDTGNLHLTGLTGSLYLEFDIPRMGRRIDAVVLNGPVVFVVEFKVGEKVSVNDNVIY